MHLDRMGDPDNKRAIFAIFKDTDQKTLGFLHGIMVYQAINILCQKALEVYGGALPRNVNFILDEYRSLNLPLRHLRDDLGRAKPKHLHVDHRPGHQPVRRAL